jgi:chromosome segregation ATPase
LKKQVLDGASANLNATNTAISASQAQLAPAVEQCNTNLAKLKADLDSKLEPLVKLQEDIKAQDDIIELAFKQLEDILGQLKNITVEMNNLATKYA